MLVKRCLLYDGAGGTSFKIDKSNYQAALHCHDKYACPGLFASTEEWMQHAAENFERGVTPSGELLQLLQAATTFKVDSVRETCLELATFGMSKLVR